MRSYDQPLQSTVLRYGAAIAIALLAVVLRGALVPWLGPQIPFITMFAAVALSVWLAGTGPAILTTLLTAIGAQWLFLDIGTLSSGTRSALVAQASYLFACGLIVLFGAAVRRRGARAARAEREGRYSEQQLQSVIDALPLLISYVGSDRRYRFNNRTYEVWFGRRRDELRGQHMRDVIGQAAYDTALPYVERALQGETVRFESDVTFPSGPRHVGVTCVPHRVDEQVAGFFALIEDIGERRRAEHARAHLAAIVESSDDAILSKTLDGRIVSWNAGAEQLFGWRAEEIVGQPILTIIPPKLHAEENDIIARLSRGERLSHRETERLTRDGRRVPVSLTVSPIRDASGRITGASTIVRDISERKAAEQALRDSEARFRNLADSVPMLIWRADRHNAATWFNRAWLEFTGRAMPQELGAGWIDDVHPEDRVRTLATCGEHTARHEPFDLELRLRRHDGEYRWLFDRGVPTFDGPGGSFSGYLGSCVDITERKLAEQQRAEADRRKDEFIATLAHELRNPLAPILSAVQSMHLQQAPSSDLQNARDIIERQARHMSRLVDDLIDLSRTSRGGIVLKRNVVDLAEAVDLAVEANRPQLERAGHRFELQRPAEPVRVDGDLTRLAQVIGNLLGNAIKYTPRGGHVGLRLQRDGDQAVISVTDDGIGIPARQLDRIFTMFTQGEAPCEGMPGGLGIGLTLARQLTEMHGGRIDAFSDGPGRGSRFVVRLPLARVDTGQTDQGPRKDEPPAASAPLSIVIADDNRDAAASLAIMLELGGHRVAVAHDGAAAVETVARLRPDVALLDIGMPQLDGYQAARRIRSLPGGERVRLIALTGWGQDADRRRSAEAGFDHHCIKPIEFEELQRLLAEPAGTAAADGDEHLGNGGT